MKVARFGRNALSETSKMDRLYQMIQEDDDRRMIVVSSFCQNEWTLEPEGASPQQLLDCASEWLKAIEMDEELLQLLKRELDAIPSQVLATQQELANEYEVILSLFTAQVVSEYLKQRGLYVRYVDPMEIGLIVDKTGQTVKVAAEAYDELAVLLEYTEILIVPGGVGYSKQGKKIAFQKEATGMTGAILSKAVEADLYEYFTDMDAVFVADPAVIDHPLPIAVLSYREVRELSYAGLSIFHDEVLFPVFSARIPIHVLNFHNTDAPGTMIMHGKMNANQIVSGIASSTGFARIYIRKYSMNNEIGFLRKLLSIFERLHINVEHIPTGMDDVTVVVRESELEVVDEDELLLTLFEELQVDEATILKNLGLLVLVGEGMANAVGTMARATAALARASVNIEFLNQGSSEVSMIFGIAAHQEQTAVRAMYKAFFEMAEEPEVKDYR